MQSTGLRQPETTSLIDLLTPRRRRPPRSMLAALVAVIVAAVVAVVIWHPFAGAQPCPAPTSRGAGAPTPVAQGAIGKLLPPSLTGFAPRPPQPTTSAWVAAGDELAPNGFLYGATQVHTRPDVRVNISVLQFSTVAGARAFDAADVHAVCGSEHRSVDLPAGLDASAMVIRSKAGTATRISMLRGSRLYLLVIRGEDVSRALRHDLATAVDDLAA